MRRLTTLFRTLRVRIRVRHCVACGAPEPTVDGYCTEACRDAWQANVGW